MKFIALAVGTLFGLAACTEVATVGTAPTPSASTGRSAASVQLERYYATKERRLQAQGLMRVDGGGVDVPFDARNLVENFERIALYDEYTIRNGRFIAQQTPSNLKRWEKPVRVQVIHGSNASPVRMASDRATVSGYANRLARLTRHSVTNVSTGGNFLVLFLDSDEQKTIGPQLQRLIPGIGKTVIDEIANSPRNTFCAAFALSDRSLGYAYSAAVILIKAEHTELMRKSCVHEEMAQAMGLANDSPQARPSIFNDDEEFALLTTHDEKLLQMLYDPRLRVGMNADAARPIVERLALELADS